MKIVLCDRIRQAGTGDQYRVELNPAPEPVTLSEVLNRQGESVRPVKRAQTAVKVANVIRELTGVQSVRLREAEDAAAIVQRLRPGVGGEKRDSLRELPHALELQRMLARGSGVHE